MISKSKTTSSDKTSVEPNCSTEEIMSTLSGFVQVCGVMMFKSPTQFCVDLDDVVFRPPML